MRIGYLPDARKTAAKLRERGYDVSEYSSEIPFDVLLYSGPQDSDAIMGVDAAAPVFMLNAGRLGDDELDRQLRDRTYSKLFE